MFIYKNNRHQPKTECYIKKVPKVKYFLFVWFYDESISSQGTIIEFKKHLSDRVSGNFEYKYKHIKNIFVPLLFNYATPFIKKKRRDY